MLVAVLLMYYLGTLELVSATWRPARPGEIGIGQWGRCRRGSDLGHADGGRWRRRGMVALTR